MIEQFIVKHYVSDERPSIKGNGFDGLEVGEDRQDAEEFIAWVNAKLVRLAEAERLLRNLVDNVGDFIATDRGFPLADCFGECRKFLGTADSADAPRCEYKLFGSIPCELTDGHIGAHTGISGAGERVRVTVSAAEGKP